MPSISVVVPVFNEEDNVRSLALEIIAVLERIGEPYEILFVNDGSTDATAARLLELAPDHPALRVVELDGNFGEASALSAGLHQARGDVVVTLDGDGQNDPADIPRLLERLRVLPSRIANGLIVWVTRVPVYDCGCGLKAYRRSAIPPIHLPRGLHRFMPAIFGVRAGEVAEVETRDRRRQHGSSHYGLGRTVVVLRDLLALRFIIDNPRGAEIQFAVATAASAAIAAAVMHRSVVAMALFDGLAVVLGAIWWNTRRFNRAQEAGVYRLRDD